MNVTLFTDASRCDKTGISAWACWAKSTRGRVEHGAAFRSRTINSEDAEMRAVANGLVVAMNAGVLEPGDRVVIATDSKAVIDRFHPMPPASKKKARRKARAEAAREMPAPEKAVRAFFAAHGLTFEFRHVKGHVAKGAGNGRNWVNNLVDGIARKAMKAARAEARKSEQGEIAA